VKNPPEGIALIVKTLNLYTLFASRTPLYPVIYAVEGNGATVSSPGYWLVILTVVHF